MSDLLFNIQCSILAVLSAVLLVLSSLSLLAYFTRDQEHRHITNASLYMRVSPVCIAVALLVQKILQLACGLEMQMHMASQLTYHIFRWTNSVLIACGWANIIGIILESTIISEHLSIDEFYKQLFRQSCHGLDSSKAITHNLG